MIVTRTWLQEWVDIKDIPTEEIVAKLNALGLEVAGVRRLDLPAKVVVGKVISCERHPDADKLSLCKVDIGSEELQIVCGAKNAKYAQYVAVATIGAQLPGGMEIKPVKLRGVQSLGMLCSSEELGLPKIEDGIMLLDSSIGELELGKELREYEIFQDEIIDIELTANRGDCLSVLGVARELATAFGKQLKKIEVDEDGSIKIGIGRLLNLNIAKEVEANLLFKAFKAEKFTNPFLIRLRLALIEERFDNRAEEFGYYITHATGVITRVYGYGFFKADEPQIVVKKDEKGYDAVYGEEKGSVVGVIQYDVSKPGKEEEQFVIETSYIDPEKISKKMHETPIKSDWSYYRSSRGSEPRLVIATEYMKYLLKNYYDNFTLYAGTHEVCEEIEKEAIKIDFDFVDGLIGQSIDRNILVEILKSLEFQIINVTEDAMIVKTPIFRHDIKNVHDVVEEIVRIYGIDNIAAKPLVFQEQNRLNSSYEAFKKRKLLKDLSIANGFYETISFLFSERRKLEEFGFESVREDLDLLNPITNELDTLRTTLVVNLLEQCEKNIKNGRRIVRLFEIGSVFDTKRQEHRSIAFLHAGHKEPESLLNQGKPTPVTFGDFVKELGAILGAFELRRCEPKNRLMHPYQCAAVEQRGKFIGYIYKLTLPVQEQLDLPATYLAEFDFDAIEVNYPKAKPFSVYQLSFKDLSILVDEEMSFDEIKAALKKLPKEVKRFYPIDLYKDERLGGKKSLTLRFAIQSDERTLKESEIATIMEEILQSLERIGAKLR